MQQVIYQIGEHELRQMWREVISAAKGELQAEIFAQNTEIFHSADAVCKRYAINRSTLHRWSKRQYLVPVQVGGKIRYKESDLRRVLEGGGK